MVPRCPTCKARVCTDPYRQTGELTHLRRVHNPDGWWCTDHNRGEG